MNEKEIIEILKDFTENENTAYCYDWQGFDYKTILPTIKGLLDLYQQEKEKNKELELKNIEIKQKQIIDKNSIPQQDNFYDYYNFISKDKIKEKIELLKYILKAKEKDGNIYKQISIEYLKGAIQQLEELLKEE